MKKNQPKLSLRRESLLRLDSRLQQARGGHDHGPFNPDEGTDTLTPFTPQVSIITCIGIC